MFKILINNAVMCAVALSLSAQTYLTSGNGDNRYPKWSPDGSKIVFESNRDGNWEIYTMLSDGSKLRRLTHMDSDDRRPSWHPDGNYILFESNRSGISELYLIHHETLAVRKIPIENCDLPIQYAAFSPSGDQIAFTSVGCGESKSTYNLFLTDDQGAYIKKITFDTTRSLYPDWSQDGKCIAFFSRRDTQNETDQLYILNLETDSVQRITHWPTNTFAPSFSPDNRFLVAAVSVENSRPELFIVEIASGLMRRLTSNHFSDTEPSWSPDGSLIVYASQEKGKYEICSIKIPTK